MSNEKNLPQDAPSEHSSTVEILDHEHRIFGTDIEPALYGYNKLPKDQQLVFEVVEEDSTNALVVCLCPPTEGEYGLARPKIVARVAPINSYFGYASKTDGEVKLFDTFVVLEVDNKREGHPIIKPGRLICKKPDEDTVLFVQEPRSLSSHPTDILNELKPDHRQLIEGLYTERFGTVKTSSEQALTYEDLMQKLDQERFS